MRQSTVKMTYIPAQYRVRVQFTKADCLASATPPDNLIARAKARLRRERKQGHIAFFRIFKTRLGRAWTLLRESQESEDTLVAVTLGTGAPLMPGVEVTAATADTPGAASDCLALLTIRAAPSAVKVWGFRPFKMFIGKRLLRLGIAAVPDAAHLHVAWLRAARGEAIRNYQVLALKNLPDDGGARPPAFEFSVSRHLGEIKLIVHSVAAVMDAGHSEQIRASILQQARRLAAQTGQSYAVRANAILRELDSANRGPERLGLDLPMVCLAAISKEPAPASSLDPQFVPLAAAAAPPLPPQKPLSLADCVVVATAADGMRTIVRSISPLVTQVHDYPKRAAWEALLTQLGITHGRDDAALDGLLARLAKGQSVVGTVLAQGQAPTAGADPYLYETFRVAPRAGDAATSLRESQQRTAVRSGQVIAEWRCKSPGQDGFDVFGRTLPAPFPTELPLLSLGDGVSRQGRHAFVAAFDGIPVIGGGAISLAKAWTIPGNVNLASGNVHFTGGVIIKGSIEAGSVVEVHGDLLVHGAIEGGLVKVSGALTVLGGIVTNHQGLIKVGGALTAHFIENSTIYGRGPIVVDKSIMSSKVYGESSLTVASTDGLIAGGEINCLDDLDCGNLGRGGTPTVVRVGCHPRWERYVAIRQHRLGQLHKLLNDERNRAKTLKARRPEQMAAQHRERQTSSEQRAERCVQLIARLTELIAQARQRTAFNAEAKVYVRNILAAACHLEVGGQHVPVPSDLIAVVVHATKKGGQYFTAVADSPAKKTA